MFGLGQTSTGKYLWSRNGRMCGNAQPTNPAETNVISNFYLPPKKRWNFEFESLRRQRATDIPEVLKASKLLASSKNLKAGLQTLAWQSQSLWASEIPQILSFGRGEVCSEEQLERQDPNWAEKEHWGWGWENVLMTQMRDVPEKQVQEVVGSRRITKAESLTLNRKAPEPWGWGFE